MTQKIASLELKNKKFIIDDNSVITTPSGRIITRHENNKGSIITYKLDGQTRRLFVADAVYRRTGLQFKNSNTVNSELFQHENTKTINNNYIFGKDTSTVGYLGSLSDIELDEKFSGFYENELSSPYTPEHLTDLMTNSTAKNYVRSLTWYEGGLSIPTFIDLAVIYIEGDYIDRLDPTIASNSTYAMGKYNNSVRFGANTCNNMTCQQYNSTDYITIYKNGTRNCSSKVYNGNQCIVIPVALIQ